MKFFLTLLISLVLVSQAYAQGTLPEEFKDLQWNRYVTKNFEILSIDEKQGLHLHKNLEKVKTWIYHHWGMKDITFKRKCMVICTPTDEMFKKFFRKEDVSPKYNDKVSAVWVSLDSNKGNWLKTIVSEKITHICLYEFRDAYDIKLRPWMVYGMSVLNTDPSYASGIISKNNFVSRNGTYINGGMSTKQIFETTFEDIESEDQEYKGKFKAQSAVLTLFLKKELTGGREKFKKFVVVENYKEGLRKVYEFRDLGDFESKYRRYLFNLVYDINRNRTPRSYFTWYEK